MPKALLQRQFRRIVRLDGVKVFLVTVLEAGPAVLQPAAFRLPFSLLMFECAVDTGCGGIYGSIRVIRARNKVLTRGVALSRALMAVKVSIRVLLSR